MAGQTVEMTQENFERITQGAGVCVVDFWAEWCGPCRGFAPTFEAAAKEFPNITFGKLDTEAQEEVSGRLEIRSLPTLVAFKDGVEVRRASGAMSASAFATWLSKLDSVDLAVEQQRAANRKLTEEGTPPPGIPPHAEWDAGDAEWCFGDTDEAGEKHGPWKYWRADGTLCNECIFVHGKPHGPFKRFHESGEVSQDGAFEQGNLHGPRTWYASDQFTTERMHENGVSEKVRRTVMVYAHGRVTQVLHYNGDGERVVPSTGAPYPTRPANLPEKAEYREDQDQWASVSLNAKTERHGLCRFWDREGQLLWEGEFREGSRHGRYHSRAVDEYADARVRFDEGEMEDDFACGTWKLLDAEGNAVVTRDLGVVQDHEALESSEVFTNLPRSAAEWRAFAEQARADRRYREALLAMARASAVSLDAGPLKAWLEALTLPRTEASAREHAEGVMNSAGDERAALADALMRGAEAATLLRGFAVLHDQQERPRAALDFILAAMLLAPERPAYLFTRSLILANLGLGEQMRKDAEALAPSEPDSWKFLSAYGRVLFPRFEFWPGRESVHCTFDEVPDGPTKDLDAVQAVVRKYATRLQLLRAEILSRFKSGANVPWLPPDVASLLPDGPVELEQTEVEDAEGDSVDIDETLSLKGLGLPALSRAVRGDWSALTWLLWACGEDALRMPDALTPPADFGHAAGQATQRLWQCRNRRTRGRIDPDLPTFDFEGVALQELHPNLAGIAEEQYAETQAMFFWLTDANHVSPWQNNLRG
ncbi:thioredoxin domain-containing protein [Myxococcus sp. SDU36]|uniref:thioredoxin domain-containing protein n=1 Tax=Myxococcus sp. SDU36 TaxID=2831967 RepID=UPI002543DBC3|nr:thioredoxin domain-containing protein [Myxococcus sp. SDU36]WIG95970.1 thiol reductase thioredoxin [Myxococcus sp. SDU36]